jgi:hypothetical protein
VADFIVTISDFQLGFWSLPAFRDAVPPVFVRVRKEERYREIYPIEGGLRAGQAKRDGDYVSDEISSFLLFLLCVKLYGQSFR